MIYLEIYILLIIISLLLCVKVDIVFRKQKKIDNKKNVSGMEIARNILDDNELQNVYVIERKEKIMDKYIYNRKIAVLSSDVYHENSLYSLAVGAYIGMHGVCDKKKDSLFNFVNAFNSFKLFTFIVSLVLFVLVVCDYKELGALMALILFLFSILFSVLEFIVNKRIAYDTYDYLKKKEYFNDSEDEAISAILRNVYLESFTWYCLSFWYSFLNLINESKKK